MEIIGYYCRPFSVFVDEFVSVFVDEFVSHFALLQLYSNHLVLSFSKH